MKRPAEPILDGPQPGRVDEPPALADGRGIVPCDEWSMGTPGTGLEGMTTEQIDQTETWSGALPAVDATAGGPGGTLPLLDGRRLGRYLLIELLGRGKQAVVWKAVQLEPCTRLVALKVFSTQWPFRRLWRVAQLRREATEEGRLAGTAVLPVYEYGEVEGYPFYTMPLISGPTLSEILHLRRQHEAGVAGSDRHRFVALPEPDYLREMIGLLARIARALGALHDAGAVHCDVKPGNILLDQDQRAYLCDFGLARLLNEELPPSHGQTSGTPIYMAREKLLDWLDVDERRCDVYSMGVTLFEALTLDRPFHIPDDMPRTDWSGYLAVATAPRPRAVRPGLPQALEAIIRKAMRRDPARRYPSASTLADDLDRFLAAESPRDGSGSGTPAVPSVPPPLGSIRMGGSTPSSSGEDDLTP